MGRPGEDEKPPPGKYFISASQLALWMFGCERKWGFQYILKLRPPGGKGAALGTVLHDQFLGPYLEFGTPLDFSVKVHDCYPAEIAATGLQFLPEPMSPGLRVEEYFKFSVPEAPHIIFRGYKDYQIAPENRPDGLPHVGDHKSCGNWAYALTADELAENIQALIYAKHALLRYPDAPAVSLQWTYYGTKKRYFSKPVCVTLTREYVDSIFSEIVFGALQVVSTLQSGRQPLELKPNRDECDKYSRDGCPFKSNCNLSPIERRPLRMSTLNPTATLLARMNATKAAAAGGAPAPTSAPVATPGLNPIQAKIAAAKAAAQAAAAAECDLPVSAPPAAPVAFAPPPPPPAAPEALPAWADPAKTPVDPHAAKSTATPAVFRAPPALPVSDQPINPPGDFQPPPLTADQAPEVAAQLVDLVAPKVKGPGRPKGSKNLVEGLDVAAFNTFIQVATIWMGTQPNMAALLGALDKAVQS